MIARRTRIKQLHRRRVGRRRGRRTFEDTDPFTGEVVATRAGRRPADAARRGRGGGRRLRGLVARRRRPSGSASSSRPPTCSKSGATRSCRCSRARPARPSASACSRSHFVPGLFRQAAALAYAPLGEVIPSDTGAFAMGMRRPVGVVGAIAPWNAALILSARSIAAPLALGNTVVLKPSEWSPWSGGLLWGEIFAEAGLPAGVLNIVTHAPATPARSATSSSRTPRCAGSTSPARRSRPACSPRRRAGTSSASCSSSAATTR